MSCLGFATRDELMAYLTTVGLGISMNFSYNSFVSAPSYVKEYYRYAAQDPSATSSMKSFWDNIESFISVANMIPNLIFQFMVFTPLVRRWKMQSKILVSMTCIIAAMLAVPICPLFKVNEHVAAGVLLGAVAVAGTATAFFGSTCFALLGTFPPRFTSGIMFGLGISGSSTSLMQIITKSAMADNYDAHASTARIYFGLSISWMLLSFVSVVFLRRNAFAKKCIMEYRDDDSGDGAYAPIRRSARSVRSVDDPSLEFPMNSDGTRVKKDNLPLSSQSTQASTSVLGVVKKIYPMMLCVGLNFTISLTVFPGVGVSINSSAWFGIIIIFMYNLGDTIGRFASNFQRIWIPRQHLLAAAISRLLVVPLFFFCLDPRWIKGDVFPMILMFITGISNGIIGSLSMMYGPQTETLETDAEKALGGNAMSLANLSGCSVGSCLALLINYLVPGESS